ncbi:MAG: Ig-like domain-containing protein [Acidobacteriota bacterium]|nr:Ig-like domain-containing protein [Acidobacteriota bacterium]
MNNPGPLTKLIPTLGTRLLSLLSAVWLLTPWLSAQTPCNPLEIRLRIVEDTVYENGSFTAVMHITNNDPVYSLEGVGIVPSFTDKNGDVVSGPSTPSGPDAPFTMGTPLMENITDIQGNGTIAAGETAVVTWQISPINGAGGQNLEGVLYWVGARLDYTLDSVSGSKEAVMDGIYVKPDHALEIDYFLPPDVVAGDPFMLAVRVNNKGGGYAEEVAITSTQSVVTDDAQSQPMTTTISRSEVNEQAGPNSFLLHFGDIPPSRAKTACWIMSANDTGEVDSFSADFTALDGNGTPLAAQLAGAAESHTLLGEVMVDLPGRDRLRDMVGVSNGVTKVYESDGSESAVQDLTGPSAGFEGSTITVPGGTTGFIFLKAWDLSLGGSFLEKVVRSDGKVLLPQNARQIKEWDKAENKYHHYIQIFDNRDAAAANTDYAAHFLPMPTGTNQAPTSATADINTASGQEVEFDPVVTDPDAGDTHTYTLAVDPAHGRAAVVNNRLSYRPDPGFFGYDSFGFLAKDSGGLWVMGTAKVLVENTNNAAPLLAAISDRTIVPNQTVKVPLTAFDDDGDALVFNAVGLPAFAGLTDNGDGTAVLVLSPVAADYGSYAVTVTVTDIHGASDQKTFHIDTTVCPKIRLFPSFGATAWSPVSPKFYIDSTTNLGIGSFSFDITYDPGILDLNGVDLTDSITAGWTVNAVSQGPGILRIEASGATDLTGSGKLLTLTGVALTNGSTYMEISNFHVNQTAPRCNSLSGVRQYVEVPGIAAHWPLDVDGDETSPNWVVAFPQGDVSFGRGKVDGAAELDGDGDWIALGYRSQLNHNGGDFAVSGWVRLDAPADGVDSTFALFSHGNATNGYIFGLADLIDGSTVLRFDGVNNGMTMRHQTALPYDVQGSWRHLAMVREGTTHFYYLDGYMFYQAEWALGPGVSNDAQAIGAGYGGADRFWHGGLDSVRFHTGAPTFNEIFAEYVHYETGRKIPAEPVTVDLAAQWDFEGNAFDSSGRNRHLTVGGSPTYEPGRDGMSARIHDTGDRFDRASIPGVTQNVDRLSFSAWVKLNTVLGGGPDKHVIAGDHGSGAGFSFYVEDAVGPTAGRLCLRIYNGTTHTIARSANLYPNDRGRHHVGFTMKNGRTRLYLDGALHSEVTDAPMPADAVYGLALGVDRTSGDPWNGNLDRVKIYTRVLEHHEMWTEYMAVRGRDGWNGAPVAVNDSMAGPAGSTIDLLLNLNNTVLNNDSDPDNDPLTVLLLEGPLHASSFLLNADGTFSYVHDGGTAETDSFTYQVHDGNRLSAPAVVDIDIIHYNQAPVFSAIANQTAAENATLSLPVSATDSEGHAIVLQAVNLPTFASLTDHDNGTGTLNIQPGFTDKGVYTLQIKAVDNGSPPKEATLAFNLTVENTYRVSAPATASAVSWSAFSIPVTIDDTTDAGLTEWRVQVDFDPYVVRLENADLTATLSDGWTVIADTTTSGRLILDATGPSPLSGEGVLVNLTGNALAAGHSDLTLSVTPGAGSPNVTHTHGRISVHAADLTAYWAFDGDLTDASGNALDGIDVNGPGFTTGVLGQALDMDGVDDYVSLGSDPLLTGGISRYTVSVWARLDAILTTAQNRYAILATINNGNGFWLGVDSNSNTVQARLRWEAYNAGVIKGAYSNHGTYPTDNDWHHLAFTKDAATAVIYVDGIEVYRTDNMTHDPGDTAGPALIGAFNSGNSYFWDGALDQLRFYDRSLAADEVFALYASGSPDYVVMTEPSTQNLQGAWSFEDTLNDNSPAGVDLSAGGSPVFSPGIDGRAIDLNGAGDYLDMGLHPTVTDGVTQLTISTWVKLDTVLGQAYSAYDFVCNFEGSSASGYRLYITDRTDPAEAGLISFRTYQPTVNNHVSTPVGTYPNDQQWHHLVVTMNGSRGSIYLDGALIARKSALVDPGDASQTNKIGASSVGNSRYWDGRFDEFKIYNRELAPHEVLAEYLETRYKVLFP